MLEASLTTAHAGLGREITWRRLAVGTFSPSTGDVVSTPSDRTVRARVSAYKATELVGLLRAGDLRVAILAAETDSVAPSTDDQLVIGGEVHEVVEVETQREVERTVRFVVAARCLRPEAA